MYREQTGRSITEMQAAGTLVNVHTVSAGRSQTLHFQVLSADGSATEDLFTEEPLMFMKAMNGERVRVTFTKESGYVSGLQIVSGHDEGYAYQEGDRRDTFPGAFLCVAGVLAIGAGVMQRMTDADG